jgi:hypothetical protein
MRVVVYSDEDLEPITVLNLPITVRDLEARGYHWRVPVPRPLPFTPKPHLEEPFFQETETVELFFERFRRRTSRWGEQDTWMCFTKADSLAMLLKPDWLPGQRSAIRYLEDQNDNLTNMLMRVIVP